MEVKKLMEEVKRTRKAGWLSSSRIFVTVEYRNSAWTVSVREGDEWIYEYTVYDRPDAQSHYNVVVVDRQNPGMVDETCSDFQVSSLDEFQRKFMLQ